MQCQLFRVLGLFIAALVVGHVFIGKVQAELTLTPGLSLQSKYDDNLFLTDEDEVDDLSMVIVPSISLALKRKYLDTDLKYSLEFRKYLDETYLDEDKIKDIHRGDASGTLFPEGRFSIPFEGSIDRVSIDDRRSDVGENNVVNVTTRYDGLVRPLYLYRLSPMLSGEVAYELSTSQYDDPSNTDDGDSQVGDIVDQDVSFTMDLDSSALLKLQLETYYNWHDSDEFDDYEMWYGLAGFVWSPLSNLSLEAKAGGAVTDVDGDKGNFNDSVFRIVLNYSQLEKLSLFASYIKDFETSVDDGRYRWWETTGGASYEDRLSGSLKFYYRENTYQFVTRDDEIYGVETKLGYDLTSSVVAGFFADYSHRTYSPISEKADRYRIGCSLTRNFENSSITLRYAFNANDSDLQTNDYQSNIVSINYNVQF